MRGVIVKPEGSTRACSVPALPARLGRGKSSTAGIRMFQLPSHSRQRQSIRLMALLFALLVASGCSSWKRLQPITPSAYAEAGVTSQMRVFLTDGRVMTVHSPRIVGDTLRGLCSTSLEAKSAMIGGGSPRESCAVALRDVNSVELKRTDMTRTAILLAFPAVFYIVLFGLAMGAGSD